MPIRIVQVDAFTNRAFAGNPAAVCVLRDTPSDQWMRDVAREMNLSETAFLVPENDGYRLRWFTPAMEVALCGHATVASAHVLWQDRHIPEGQQARFHTLSGLLTADRRGEWIELDFPAKVAEPAEAPPDLLTALGPYWAGVLGKSEFTAYQASPRGGVVKVRVAGDRVKLGGQAVTVMTGELNV